ncbi:RBTMx2-like protein, partial [Fusarium heterosporum]
MEQNSKSKSLQGLVDIMNKNNGRSKDGGDISLSIDSPTTHDRGSCNDQHGVSTQHLTKDNKLEATDNKLVTDDPFHNERRRILFDAINKLQFLGSHDYLEIPQASLVGEQSAGKSSLLKSLTNIPFPVKSGIGTHFPIRIISRRTPLGTSEHFRIYVNKAPCDVEGLKRADSAADKYTLEGDTLTMSMFAEALQDLSENYIKIDKGTGQLKKNFVPDIVTVELSGPNRSLFNILDLPGLVNSSVNINESELGGTHRLAIQYISKRENTVICTLPATAELSTQKVFDRCKRYVPDKRQLIGVFTKCDLVTSPNALKTVVSSTQSRSENSESAFENGMFVVCNEDDSESGISGSQIEQRVFDREPWAQIPAERRGTSKLKDHLGEILTSQIEKAFPQIEQEIQTQLSKKRARLSEMGDVRTHFSQNQAYLNRFVREYSIKAEQALGRPGFLESPDMDLRQKLGDLNTQFGDAMRWIGGVWTFGDGGIDPGNSCLRYKAVIDNNEIDGKEKNEAAHQALYEITHWSDEFKPQLDNMKAFEKYKGLESSEDFGNTIKRYLRRFGASQLPGVINSDIYPVIYRLQVSKWGCIAQEHLERVRDALKLSYEEILNSTCPKTGSTSILHDELRARLHWMFEDTFSKARRDLESYCKRETERVFLQIDDPRFSRKLNEWRSL